MKNKIHTNHTLEEYKKKYGKQNLSKVNIGEADKDPKVLSGRSWWLIKDTYYEVPSNKGFKSWWSNLGKGGQIALCSLLGAGVATAVIVPTVIAINNKGITHEAVIDVDTSGVTIASQKYNNGNLEVIISYDIENKEIKTLELYIGNERLDIEVDYTFDGVNKIVINKETLNKNKAREVVIKPTLENKAPTPSIKSIKLSKTTMSLSPEGTDVIKASVETQSNIDIDWTIEGDKDVISLSKSSTSSDEEIKVTAKKAGSVSLVATCGDKSEKCNVTVSIVPQLDEIQWKKAFNYFSSDDCNYSSKILMMDVDYDFKRDKNNFHFYSYDPARQEVIDNYKIKLNNEFYIEYDKKGNVDDILTYDPCEGTIKTFMGSYADRYKDFKDSYNKTTGEYCKTEENTYLGIKIKTKITIKFIKSNDNVYVSSVKAPTEYIEEGGKKTTSDYYFDFSDYNTTKVNIPEGTNIVEKYSKGESTYNFESRKYDDNNKRYLYKVNLNEKFEKNKYLKISLNDKSTGKLTPSLLQVSLAINGKVFEPEGEVVVVIEDGVGYIPNDLFKDSENNEIYLLTTCVDETNNDLNFVLTLNAEKEEPEEKLIYVDGSELYQTLLEKNISLIDCPTTIKEPKITINYSNSTGNSIELDIKIKKNGEVIETFPSQIFLPKVSEEPTFIELDISNIWESLNNGDSIGITASEPKDPTTDIHVNEGSSRTIVAGEYAEIQIWNQNNDNVTKECSLEITQGGEYIEQIITGDVLIILTKEEFENDHDVKIKFTHTDSGAECDLSISITKSIKSASIDAGPLQEYAYAQGLDFTLEGSTNISTQNPSINITYQSSTGLPQLHLGAYVNGEVVQDLGEISFPASQSETESKSLGNFTEWSSIDDGATIFISIITE